MSCRPCDAARAQPALVAAREPADRQRREQRVRRPRRGRAPRAASGTRRSSGAGTAAAGSRASAARRASGWKTFAKPGLDHLAPQQLVLGVRDVAVGDPPPRPARDAAVDVGEERQRPGKRAVGLERRRRAPEPLDVDLAPRRPRSRSGAPSRLDHVRGVRARVVRAEHERDVVGLREALEQRGQPAVVRGRRVLGEERDVLALGELHHPVARAAVGELVLGDAVDRARRGARRSRASRRSSPSRRSAARPRGRVAARARRRAPRRGTAPRCRRGSRR